MKKLKYRRFLFVLVALLLLLPTVLLVVQAFAVGNFPKEGESALIRITAPSGEVTELTKGDPLYGVVHDLFSLADRVSHASLPKERETYLLDFQSGKVSERVKLYIATAHDRAGGEYIACYLLSSEERLYRLDLPSSRILTRILTPAIVDWISDESGEEKVLHTYAYSENKDAYPLIKLSDWSALSSLVHSAGKAGESFRLFDEKGDLIVETADPSGIEAYSPARVFYTVRSELVKNAFLESTYVFALGE